MLLKEIEVVQVRYGMAECGTGTSHKLEHICKEAQCNIVEWENW